MKLKDTVLTILIAPVAVALLFTTSIASGRSVDEPPIQFSHLDSQIDGSQVEFSVKETARVEQVLQRVFPTRQMQRHEHVTGKPAVRQIVYTIIRQAGKQFVLAGFSARWNEAVNVLALYRIEAGGWPNQIWRSNPWEATYYGLKYSTANVGRSSIVLFEEGTATSTDYSLASVFTFHATKRGIVLHDVTPQSQRLQALTEFPFRPLFARGISLRVKNVDDGQPRLKSARSGDARSYDAQASTTSEIYLSASDAEYHTAKMQDIRLTTMWKLNPHLGRFDSASTSTTSEPANIGAKM